MLPLLLLSHANRRVLIKVEFGWFFVMAIVLQILRFGRCTLVTTFQIYIILALNSLINAYSLSVLYIDGVKNGDLYKWKWFLTYSQMTVSGVFIAALFFFISGSKPLKSLSPERPGNHWRSIRYSLWMLICDSEDDSSIRWFVPQ